MEAVKAEKESERVRKMTPKQLEAAARKLCEIRGVDPDEAIGIIEGESIVFQWCIVADEIRAYLEIQEAINSIPQPSPHVIIRQGQGGVPLEVMEEQSQVETCGNCLHAMHHHWRVRGCDKCGCAISTAHPF